MAPLGSLLLALGALFSLAAGEESAETCSAEGGCELRDSNPEGYFWRRRAGSNEVVTSVPGKAPVDFSKGPSWVWPNELDEQVRHSPLIDHEKSIYVCTPTRVRKFSHDGKLLWTWTNGPAHGKITTSPAIDQGRLYALSTNTRTALMVMYALDMASGKQLWSKEMPQSTQHPDANSLLVYNETAFFAGRDRLVGEGDQDGNNVVRAMSLTDQELLWEYTLNDVVWNMLISTPGDGTLLFASTCGSVYRLGFDGKLMWQSGRRPARRFCSCGGGVLGPGGLFYSAFNDPAMWAGVVTAHSIEFGEQVWERQFPAHYGGWQYPGVGRIGPSGRLAVVAPMGSITGSPRFPGVSWMEKDWLPLWARSFVFENLYLRFSWFRSLIGVPALPNAVSAMDAKTGEQIWWLDEEPWNHYAAAGDEAPFLGRYARTVANPDKEDLICLPDNQGIPVIGGDGTVYVSSGHTGDMAAVRDNGDGFIEAKEVNIFKTGQCFLNSPSLAPGMVVAAPCWGPVYVFKD